jgi:hypothetical protein
VSVAFDNAYRQLSSAFSGKASKRAAARFYPLAELPVQRSAGFLCLSVVLDVQEHRRRSSELSFDWSNERPSGEFRFEEAPVELPEDIRRTIEKSGDQDTILDVVSRLQSEEVKITHDVIAAIVATIAATKGGAVC